MKKIKSRHFDIDYLRGIAIFSVILIHSTSYFLVKKSVFFVWDLNQFAVVLFVFCSSYILFRKPAFTKFGDFFSYVKKRIIRLILPYYVFLAIYFPLVMIREGKKLSPNFIFQSLVLVGGVDLNWLVLLFVMFSFIIPFLLFLYRKHRPLLYLYSLVSLISSLVFLFYKPAFNYKLIMWLPWSLVGVTALFFIKYKKNKVFLTLGALFSFLIYLILRVILIMSDKSLTMFDNKYPPNLFHLSYGIIFLFLFWRSFAFWVRPFPVVKKFLFFLSQNSYSLFFIHFLIIYIVTVLLKAKFTWFFFFIVVLSLSLTTQFVLNKTLTFFRR